MVHAVASQNKTITQEGVYLVGGHAFCQDPLSPREQDELADLLVGGYGYKPGECYMNAGRIAVDTDLPFCEGFAAGPWPVPHGWNVYKGRAIDVTWPVRWTRKQCYTTARTKEQIMERVNHNIANCVYWGIEIPSKIASAHFVKQKSWSPVFDPRFFRDYESLPDVAAVLKRIG